MFIKQLCSSKVFTLQERNCFSQLQLPFYNNKVCCVWLGGVTYLGLPSPEQVQARSGNTWFGEEGGISSTQAPVLTSIFSTPSYPYFFHQQLGEFYLNGDRCFILTIHMFIKQGCYQQTSDARHSWTNRVKAPLVPCFLCHESQTPASCIMKLAVLVSYPGNVSWQFDWFINTHFLT